MNCKPGDLAVIVRSGQLSNIGKLVKVLRGYEGRPNSWWVCCDSELQGFYSAWPAGAEVGQYDHHLRPIRDPGDDARDETLEWLPVPSRDEVTA